MKWYFLFCFICCVVTACLWTALILFGLMTSSFSSRRNLAIFAPLVFFVWAAREMFLSYLEEKNTKSPHPR